LVVGLPNTSGSARRFVMVVAKSSVHESSSTSRTVNERDSPTQRSPSSVNHDSRSSNRAPSTSNSSCRMVPTFDSAA
jgi:hypothetical protein